MTAITDPAGAFVPGRADARSSPLGNGRLSGLGFAAKDVFDVAGAVTTYRQPGLGAHPRGRRRDRPGRHGLASGRRPPGRQDQDGGARLRPDRGEPLARDSASIRGRPIGCRAAPAPARRRQLRPGSSISPSAPTPPARSAFPRAIAACSASGRASARSALAGVCPLAPSLDTVGWFTRDAALLSEVGEVLLPERARRDRRPAAAAGGGVDHRPDRRRRRPAPGAGAPGEAAGAAASASACCPKGWTRCRTICAPSKPRRSGLRWAPGSNGHDPASAPAWRS